MSFTQAMTGPRQGYKLQRMSFGILICLHCHIILTCTPQSGYREATKVAKNANIVKGVENCRNCKRCGVGTQAHFSNTFLAQKSKKTKTFVILDRKRRGGLGGVSSTN